MSKPGIVVCMPLDDETQLIPGSLPDKCTDCGQAVSVSPSSWQILHDNPGTKVVCIYCALATKGINVQPMTRSQIADMVSALNEEGAG